MDLAGKRALVCGSSQGIGRACAIELARRGASVLLAARDASALQAVASSLDESAGQRHASLVADFSNPESLEEKVRGNLSVDGPLQILINNTGGPSSGPMLDAAPADFLSAITRHVVCNQLLVRALLPGMKASKYGRVINIVSTSVVTPIRGLGVSNTTRAAVANWARTLADELGQYGITVNNVLPGFTDTTRLKSLLQKRAETQGVSLDEVVRQAKAGIPMQRFAEPSEIASVVGFLASPAASYVSGVNLPVDGGRLAVQ
jgi:3-oxoacyl-[acyl-carrier protein] reductase